MTPTARLASHLMAAVGLAMLASTRQINDLLVALGGAGVVLSLILDRVRVGDRSFSAATNAFILATLVFAVVDYAWLSPSLLHVGAHVLVLLMLTRLRHRDAREYLQLAVIVFLQVLAAAGLSAQANLAAGFVAYLIVMVWVLLHYHLLHEHALAGSRIAGVEPGGVAGWGLIAAATALLVTGALFVFIPRAGFGLFAPPPKSDIRLTGFSPHITLGTLGPVKRDPTVIMRVSGGFIIPGLEPLYLRGAVFDAFDGRGWLSTAPVRRLLKVDGEGRFALESVPARSVVSTVRLEAIDSSILFAPGRTVAIGGPFSTVSVDDQLAFGMPLPSQTRTTYQVWQRPGSAAILGEPGAAPGALARYLAFNGSAPIAGLARDVSEGAQSPVERARAVERFLKTRYAYTLDVPGGEEDPLGEFLFRRRSGFCEHFASAMVLMLRALDIPARVVNGFLVKEWNEYGRYFMVRQGDAHAWVEAYLPDQGWTRFDPTPPAPPGDRPWDGGLQHYLDSLRLGWDRYVVEFGLSDQDAAIQRAQTGWHTTKAIAAARVAEMGEWWRSLETGRLAVWGAAVALVGALGLVLVVARRVRSWSRRRPASSQPPRVEFYTRLLGALAQRGLSKPAAATPLEFATRNAADLPCAAEVRRITDYYYGVRYGRRRLSAAERRALETCLTAIEQTPTAKT